MNRDPYTASMLQRWASQSARSGPELRWENEGGRLRVLRDESTYSIRSQTCDQIAQEHALLLNQVSARADAVLEAVAAGRWPEQELTDLIDYLRSELIEQTRTEERLLFTAADANSAEAFGRLARDHARLRNAMEALTDAAGAHSRTRQQPEPLSAIVRGLVTQLAAHLSIEEDILFRDTTSAGWQEALAAMQQHPHAWYPLTHGSVIDLDAFSPAQAIDAVTRRAQQLLPGEHIELSSSNDPQRLCRRLLRDHNIAVHYLINGPETWHISITRRRHE